MLRIFLALFLIAGVWVYTTPVQAQQTTEETQAAFEAELTEYAATHSDDELRAYAAMRLSEITDQALGTGNTSPLAAVISPEVWYGTSSLDDRPGDKWGGEPIDPTWDGDSYKICLSSRFEECRRNYNADVLTSAAVATAIAAGCAGYQVARASSSAWRWLMPRTSQGSLPPTSVIRDVESERS